MQVKSEAPPQELKLFIDGQWVDAGPPIEVHNKYSGEVLATLPSARQQEVDAAFGAAERAATVMADMPAHKRAGILARASVLIRERGDELARSIATEAGKALKFARAEVDRGATTFAVAAEEAKRIHGETVPLDAVPAGEGYFGFFLRRPLE
jgi:acyl-CoA reductase-like NAD-dependent aldehyde dehydrogenase